MDAVLALITRESKLYLAVSKATLMLRYLLLAFCLLLGGLLACSVCRTVLEFRERVSPNYRTKAHLAYININLLHRYHGLKGHFPPAYLVDSNGNRLHSWRTL